MAYLRQVHLPKLYCYFKKFTNKMFSKNSWEQKSWMSFRSMFFRDIFYWLKLYSKFLTILVYALVGVSSLLLFMVKINQWKKSLKVISFTYTLLSKLERQFYLFWGWSKGGGGGVGKVNKRDVWGGKFQQTFSSKM